MHILLYYPSNKRTVSLETLFRALKQRGHKVSMLTMCERGDLHDEMDTLGIAAYGTSVNKSWSLLYYFRHLIQLIKFCKQHKVDVVFSHLQQANLVAVFANYLMACRVILFRHHDYSRTRNEAIGDRLINQLAQVIVVPSSGVRNLMVRNEKIKTDKIKLIPYVYDFAKYEYPATHEIMNLREQYVHAQQTLLLIMVARMVPAKRHKLVFDVVKLLKEEDYDVQLLVLDEGPEKEDLIKYVHHQKLQNYVHFIGFTRKVTCYLAAADLMVHPSVSEASNSAVKEAGLLERAVVVCEGVGDFSDYIQHSENGFLISKDNTVQELATVIKLVYNDRSLVTKLGRKLKETVAERFFLSEKIMEKYEQLLISS